ncbi:hypothetical protein GIY23_22395 [Allosaccharopolyspora coralli]|uniref:Uncharacterized protein n=1 Tax=Allosaccharopolyspora coralli TaxID=2665642 RepID=A0A5Q3QF66_9PSEU|nr:hypothetical protein [Allosaccharopolyspora coralli]QGK71884.1 hypothetical protein GIY23_22395 [Allosaccharopolyspora coralli]
MSTFGRIIGIVMLAGTGVAAAGIVLSGYSVFGVDAAPPPPTPTTVTVTPEQSKAAPPEEVAGLQPGDSGALMDESMFVRTFDADTGNSVQLVQKPDEFLPPHITGVGPAEVLAFDIEWAHWDSEKAVGNCTVRVTGGGADPEVREGVRIVLDEPAEKDGVAQYTRYTFDWGDGEEPDVGDLTFSS